MTALYRKRSLLPSVWPIAALILLGACDSPAPPPRAAEPVSNRYLEAVQEAEALKHSIEERNLEQQRIDALLEKETPARR